MRLLVNHQTHYQYQEMVLQSQQYIRMTPKSDANQRVKSWSLATMVGETESLVDGFGNILSSLSIVEPHQQQLIMAQGEVELLNEPSFIDDHCPLQMFSYSTSLTQCHEPLLEFIKPFQSDIGLDVLKALSEAILKKMPYQPSSTDSRTTAAEAFDLGQGVCQDHAHVFLACTRAMGIVARYASGYLYTHDTSHLATHAWTEVCLNGRWYTFDITNQLFTPSHHIKMAIGRDYLDAAPVRGVRQNGGIENMNALVQVLTS